VASLLYDHNGNPDFYQDAAGGLTLAVYDPLNRPIKRISPVGSTTLLTYTATALAQVQDTPAAL
jgi:YD repeat-containing protein